MDEKTQAMAGNIPQEMMDVFFNVINQKLGEAQVETGMQFLPTQITSIIHSTLGGILINYFTNHVEPHLRDYLASKMMFGLSGLLHEHLETLESTQSRPEVLDPNKSV